MQSLRHEIVDRLSTVSATVLEQVFFGEVTQLHYCIEFYCKTALSLLLCDALRKLKQRTRASRRHGVIATIKLFNWNLVASFRFSRNYWS